MLYCSHACTPNVKRVGLFFAGNARYTKYNKKAPEQLQVKFLSYTEVKMVVLNVILGVFVQFLSNPTILIALIVLIGLLMQKKNMADCIKGTVKTS